MTTTESSRQSINSSTVYTQLSKQIEFDEVDKTETDSVSSEHLHTTSTSPNETTIEQVEQHTSQYIPPWQQWFIRKSQLLKPTAWNIIIWMFLILGFVSFQAIAWKTYWWNDERKFLGPSNVELICSSDDDMDSKYVSQRSKVSCKIITTRSAKLNDFVDPPYKLAEIDETNKQPFVGIDGGVYFEFSFIAPQESGTYTVECLTYKDMTHTTHVVDDDTIHVIEVAPNDISIDCVGLMTHSYYVHYKEMIACSVSTQTPASLGAFFTPGTVILNGEIQDDIRLIGNDPSTIFKFEYTTQCEPDTLIFEVRISDAIIVPNRSPLVTVQMANEYQVHIHCYNPRTNGTIVSRQETVTCRINTVEGLYARTYDFADPVLSVTPEVPYISQLKVIRSIGNGSLCGQEFEVSFTTPSIDVDLEIRGHLRSGGTMFADDAVVIQMGHVRPMPHELKVSCRGDLSGNEGVALHQETIVCQIVSEFEFMRQDFSANVFKVADGRGRVFKHKVIDITSFAGRHHKQGLREETHKEYDVRFNILDDAIKQLELYLVLNDSRIVNENDPMIINTISCPRDGAISCKHWEWNLVTKGGDNTLKLLPSTEHYYFSEWKYITFEGLAHADKFTELTLDDNELPSINESIFSMFESVRRLSLKNNKFTSLNEKIFGGLYNLKEVDVSYNDIEYIEYKTFDSVLQVTTINFEHNQLDKLPSVFHTVHMLSNLRELNVMNNGLKYIEEELFRIQSIQKITIGGTFNCIPSFLSRDFRRKVNVFPQGTKCTCPSALLEGELCGDWHYNKSICIRVNNNTVEQCHPALIHNGQLSSLTALDSLDLDGFDHVGYVNISNNNLTVLPNTFLRHFPKLRILDVSSNKIAALHSNTFETLSPNILILDANHIQSLSPLIFSVSLTYLSIQNNRIDSIPSYVLHNLPDLQYINLAHNAIASIPHDFLQNSMILTDMILANNQLDRVDQQMFDNKKIANIDLSSNRINVLSSYQFDNISDLAILDLSYNKLTGLPNHLFNPNINLGLYELDFTGNTLYNIAPYFLPSASDLNFLMFGDNYLTTIDPHSFEKYTNLIELDLHSNSFTTISHQMFPFSESLIKLNLANNPLLEIESKTFYKFPNLYYLDLSHTDLPKIDVDDFNGVPLLRDLNLEFGTLETLQINQFRHLMQLESLKMSNNRLQSISELNFGAELKALTTVEIDHNPFIWIGDKTFANLPKLQSLDLSHCNLTSKHISDHAFGDSQLVSLQLSHNHLTELNSLWFDDLKQMKQLNLTHNPIQGIKSDTFNHAISLELIDLRKTHILCLPRWLKALGVTVLMDREEERNCVSCMDKGMWSNGTNVCAPCGDNEVCMNDEWDETGTFRLKTSVAGVPPSADTFQFKDTDPHPNLIGGVLSWGEIPDESIGNTEEWAIYLSMDGVDAHGSAIVSVDVTEGNSYRITDATDVGFNRWFLMYGRNGGGDGKAFTSVQFEDQCDICVSNFTFDNKSPRNYHIFGEAIFIAPLNQERIANYKIYIGHDPYHKDNIVDPLKEIEVQSKREYKVMIEEINTNGMPYIWIRSFYEDESENNTPTNDVQSLKIIYDTRQQPEAMSVARDVLIQS